MRITHLQYQKEALIFKKVFCVYNYFVVFLSIYKYTYIYHQSDLFDEMASITLVNINLLGHNIWMLIKMSQHLFVILYMQRKYCLLSIKYLAATFLQKDTSISYVILYHKSPPLWLLRNLPQSFKYGIYLEPMYQNGMVP